MIFSQQFINGLSLRERVQALWPVPAHFDVLRTGEYENDFIKPVIDQVLRAADGYLGSGELFPVKAFDHQGAVFDALTSTKHHLGYNSSTHILPLVEAYYLTGNTVYAAKAVSIIPKYLAADWIGSGTECVNLSMAFWCQGLLPSISWLLQSPHAEIREQAAELLPALQEKMELCFEYLDAYVDNPHFRNNHWTVAACALGQVSLLLAGEKGAASLQKSLNLVKNHLFFCEKIGADGEWFEDAVMYHQLVLFHVMHFSDALKAVGGMDMLAHEKVRRMFEVLLYYSAPDGSFSDFNDSQADSLPARGIYLLARGAVEYQSSDLEFLLRRVFAYRGTRLSTAALILRYYDVTQSVEPALPRLPLDRHLPLADQIISRSNWEDNASYCALNSGIVLPHSHFDRGTFTFYYQGRPMVIDSGKGQPYTLGKQRSEMYASHHNTAFSGEGYRIKDEDCGTQPFDAVTTKHLHCRAMTYTAINTTALAQCKRATRQVFFSKSGYLVIIDDLEDDTLRDYHQVFHGIGSLSLQGDRSIWEQEDGTQLQLHTCCSAKIETLTGAHDVYGRGGMVSQEFVDHQVKSERVRYVSCLFPVRPGEEGGVTFSTVDGLTRLQINKDGMEDTFVLNPARDLVSQGGNKFDARIIWFREENRRLLAWGAIDGWEVLWQGKNLTFGDRSELHREITPLRCYDFLVDFFADGRNGC